MFAEKYLFASLSLTIVLLVFPLSASASSRNFIVQQTINPVRVEGARWPLTKRHDS